MVGTGAQTLGELPLGPYMGHCLPHTVKPGTGILVRPGQGSGLGAEHPTPPRRFPWAGYGHCPSLKALSKHPRVQGLQAVSPYSAHRSCDVSSHVALTKYETLRSALHGHLRQMPPSPSYPAAHEACISWLRSLAESVSLGLGPQTPPVGEASLGQDKGQRVHTPGRVKHAPSVAVSQPQAAAACRMPSLGSECSEPAQTLFAKALAPRTRGHISLWQKVPGVSQAG